MAMEKRGPVAGSKIHRFTDSFREAPCARTGDEVGGPFSRKCGAKGEYVEEWLQSTGEFSNLKILYYIYVYIDWFCRVSRPNAQLKLCNFSSCILSTWLNWHTLSGIAKVDIPESQLRQRIKFGKPMYLYDHWSQRISSSPWGGARGSSLMLRPCPTFVASQDVQGEVVCAKQRKECFLREVQTAKGNSSCVQIFQSLRDLDGSVVYLKLSDFPIFFWEVFFQIPNVI